MRLPILGISAFCLAIVPAALLVMPAMSVEAKTVTQAPIPAPPAEPVFEVDPGERPGYTWSPGYWRWNGEQHTWNSGHWVADRPGYRWMPDGWEQRGEIWRFAKGHWEKNSPEIEEEESAPVAADAPPTIAPAEVVPSAAAKRTKATKAKPATKRSATRPNYRSQRLYPPVVHH